MHSRRTWAALMLASFTLAQDCSETCQSFGVNIIGGGTYFQNINSTQPFTALQEFEGCQDDSSYNMLVGPSGTQYQCNNTPMTPNDTPQLVTCPIDKDQLVTGEWQLIVISNNGQCNPIDYVRQFSLAVGEQSTTTVAPTITLTSTATPISSTITTHFSAVTISAAPTTTVVPGPNARFTITQYPLPSFIWETRGVFTRTEVSQIARVVATSTVTPSESCGSPSDAAALAVATVGTEARRVPDAWNSWQPVEILGKVINAWDDAFNPPSPNPVPTRKVSSAFRGRRRHVVQVREIEKRAPDAPTVTVTESGSTATVTSTITAPVKFLTGTTTVYETTTTTPVVTVQGKQQFLTTVTAQALTITDVFWVPVTDVAITRTQDATVTVTAGTGSC